MTVCAPSTTSPPAKTRGSPVWNVQSSTSMVRHGALDALLVARAVELGVLADGDEDLVALDDELGALDRDGAPAPGGVRLAELHALHLDAGDLVLVVGHDAHRRDEQSSLTPSSSASSTSVT